MLRLPAALLLCVALCARAALGWAGDWEPFFKSAQGDMRAELAQAREAGKQGLFVMYQFEACPYCARMKREILSRPEVQQAYRQHFTAIQVDTTGTRPMRGFDGRILPEKDFAKSLGIHGGPIFVFYSLDGQALLTYPLPLYDAPSFIALGDYVASGAYRDMPFPVYVRNKRKSS